MGGHEVVGQPPGGPAGEGAGQRGGREPWILQRCPVCGPGPGFGRQQQGGADLHGIGAGLQQPGCLRRCADTAGGDEFGFRSIPLPDQAYQLCQRLRGRLGCGVERSAVPAGARSLQAQDARSGSHGQRRLLDSGDRHRHGRSCLPQPGDDVVPGQAEGEGDHRDRQPLHQVELLRPPVVVLGVGGRQRDGGILAGQLAAVGQRGGKPVRCSRATGIRAVRNEQVDPERFTGQLPGGGDFRGHGPGGLVAGGQEPQPAGIADGGRQGRGGGPAGHRGADDGTRQRREREHAGA